MKYEEAYVVQSLNNESRAQNVFVEETGKTAFGHASSNSFVTAPHLILVFFFPLSNYLQEQEQGAPRWERTRPKMPDGWGPQGRSA